LSLTNPSEIDTVIWNFDDPDSGVNNASTTINTNHQFTAPGIYQVSANVKHINGTSYTITKEIEIFEAPIINETVSLKQCDNSDINGFSFFNLEEVKSKIIANPENYTITFFEERTLAENNDLNSIQNTTSYSNELVSNDVIWARVEDTNGCFSISKIQLIVSTTEIPLGFKKSFYECDDGLFSTDGIATFNFSSVTQEVIDLFPPGQQLIINYYESEADALAEENEITNISNYQNTNSPTQQTIYIRVDSAVNNDCLGLGPHITLNVDRVPIANTVTFAPECDNDRDGLFMFNSSTIQNTIIGNQTGVEVSYYDESGNPLPSPLPNPFASASQTITARITNSNSQDPDGQCYDETQIEFIVNSVPMANQVPVQEVCDDDLDGVVGFDTSTIETTILGVQTDLIVKYYDGNNNALPSPLPNPFYTTSQTISVRLENPNYDVCYEETTIDFRVREKPTFDLAEKATICMTNTPELTIAIENPNGYHSYTWKDENNTIISSFSDVTIIRGGVYKVFATSIFGCSSIEKEIIIEESSKAIITIDDIEVIDDTNNNSIKVNTSNLGLGAYEFQLLDDNSTIISDYQNTPFFDNLEGGVYSLVVNDINGCGAISFDVSLLSFPKFFTPNEDGINDYWKIKGISRNFYQSGSVSIFNRYGKLISKHNIDDIGWDGTYNGKILSSNNYWFYAELVDVNGKVRTRSGNFSLLRN
jgi:gliding motility-associated-like protein